MSIGGGGVSIGGGCYHAALPTTYRTLRHGELKGGGGEYRGGGGEYRGGVLPRCPTNYP